LIVADGLHLEYKICDLPAQIGFVLTASSKETRDEMDSSILEEINGCVFENVKGFYEKYFEGKPWSPAVDKIVQAANPQILDCQWTEYPTPLTKQAFLEWFWTFQTRFLQGARGAYYACHSGKDSNHPDLFLAPSGTTKHEGKYRWADILVIGELEQSEILEEHNKELVLLYEHALEIFKSQPTRRFLHGFFIRGSLVELWVFDRSGFYSGEKFDIHKNPQRFIQVMAGYTMMSDEDLGMNTYIKEDEVGKYVMFKGEDTTEEEKLYLQRRPLAFHGSIMCRGTVCYRAKKLDSERWQFVVKFSWRMDRAPEEGNLLRLAKERHVWGVAGLFYHKDLESIVDMRRGMQFGEPISLQLPNGSSSSDSRSGSSGLLSGLGISTESLSLSERKKGEKSPNDQSKSSRSNNNSRQTDITSPVTKEDGNIVGAKSVEQEKTTSLGVQTSGPFTNLTLSCVVTYPPGRKIYEYEFVNEFLEACRDIIKAHRSLYQDGKILHRDISVNNMIITDAHDVSDPRGMLIDLDAAREVDVGRRATHSYGTVEFMAIEVLEGTVDTYRHDLESIFYVFLWVIIRYGDDASHPPKPLWDISTLWGWGRGNWKDLARRKVGEMDKRVFRQITTGFPAKFAGIKELAEELRQILFPIRDGALFTGTDDDPETLYTLMIGAFDRAIQMMS
jgi:Fungal protein kinase